MSSTFVMPEPNVMLVLPGGRIGKSPVLSSRQPFKFTVSRKASSSSQSRSMNESLSVIVTCSSRHSRNFMAGYAIGKAGGAEQFLKENRKTVEGIPACKAVHDAGYSYMFIEDKIDWS